MSLWPQSFLRTSLLYRCLTQSIAIPILININLLISIKIRLPLDQFSLASVWHCRPLITQTTPPPHHSHTHMLTDTHTYTRTHAAGPQPLTLPSIRLTVFVRVSTVIKKCPWCNFMPVDTQRPYAKDYGTLARGMSVRCCEAGGLGHFIAAFNGPCCQCSSHNGQIQQSVRWGLPSASATEQPGNPAPPASHTNLSRQSVPWCRSICRVSVSEALMS